MSVNNDNNNFLVNIDRVCDYIPGLSTVSNLVDIFQKSVVTPCMTTDSVKKSRYYTHLNNKSMVRCLALLIPVIGNFLVAAYDYVYNDEYTKVFNDKNAMLQILRDPDSLDSIRTIHAVGEGLRDSEDFMFEAVKIDYRVIGVASARLRDDENFLKKALLAAYEGGLKIGPNYPIHEALAPQRLPQLEQLPLKDLIQEIATNPPLFINSRNQQQEKWAHVALSFFIGGSLRTDREFLRWVVQKDMNRFMLTGLDMRGAIYSVVNDQDLRDQIINEVRAELSQPDEGIED